MQTVARIVAAAHTTTATCDAGATWQRLRIAILSPAPDILEAPTHTFWARLPRSSLPPKQMATSCRRLCGGVSTAAHTESIRFCARQDIHCPAPALCPVFCALCPVQSHGCGIQYSILPCPTALAALGYPSMILASKLPGAEHASFCSSIEHILTAAPVSRVKCTNEWFSPAMAGAGVCHCSHRYSRRTRQICRTAQRLEICGGEVVQHLPRVRPRQQQRQL